MSNYLGYYSGGPRFDYHYSLAVNITGCASTLLTFSSHLQGSVNGLEQKTTSVYSLNFMADIQKNRKKEQNKKWASFTRSQSKVKVPYKA